MTSSIPDGISFGELEALAKAAPTEKTPELPFEERVRECVDRHLDQSADEIGDPMVHKEMLLEICRRMIGWHTEIGATCFEKDAEDMGVAWLRDAGKFQAAMAIIMGVSLGPNDYTDSDD